MLANLLHIAPARRGGVGGLTTRARGEAERHGELKSDELKIDFCGSAASRLSIADRVPGLAAAVAELRREKVVTARTNDLGPDEKPRREIALASPAVDMN